MAKIEADGNEQCVRAISGAAVQPVASEQSVILGVTDHWFDHRASFQPAFPAAKFPALVRPRAGGSASSPNAPAEMNAENIPRRKNIACTDRAPSARTPLHPTTPRYASAIVVENRLRSFHVTRQNSRSVATLLFPAVRLICGESQRVRECDPKGILAVAI